MPESVRIVFVCTGNSARSQMAEGFARAWGADHLWVESAGTRPFGLSANAVAVMAEVGIDISHHQSKGLDQIDPDPDVVITLCDHAAQQCGSIPAARQQLHWPTLDPAHAGLAGDPRDHYRRIRDALGERVRTFLAEQGWLKPGSQESENASQEV